MTYFDCDFPHVDDQVKDPGLFYKNQNSEYLVFDEIHQLSDPSRLLKIGADHFPQFKILATGSSTLAASAKFKDTLTGRKTTVRLTPVLWSEIETFNVSIERRLYHGGLPPALLAADKKPGWYREWLDSFFARDIQRLFSVRRGDKFVQFFDYVLKQSGGLFETAKAARDLGLSRSTVEGYAQALEVTQAIRRLRPFYGGGRLEVTRAPKLYAFDTGFVSFSRGWDPLRSEDRGLLWEHVVLDYISAIHPDERLCYWRDRSGREIDFVISRSRNRVDIVECKWDVNHFDPSSLKAFRQFYPEGRNYLIHPSPMPAHPRSFQNLVVTVGNPIALRDDNSEGI